MMDHDSDRDPTLSSQVKKAFELTGYQDLRDVACQSDGSTVILNGHVRSFYMKQTAQQVAMGIPGVRQVFNRVAVHHSSGYQSPSVQ